MIVGWNYTVKNIRKGTWKKLKEWKDSINQYEMKYVKDGGNKYVKLGK